MRWLLNVLWCSGRKGWGIEPLQAPPALSARAHPCRHPCRPPLSPPQATSTTPWPVAVRPTRHGKGLHVTAGVRAGAVVLVELPLVAAATAASRAQALACGRCAAYLASPGGQLAHGLLTRGEGVKGGERWEEGTAGLRARPAATHPTPPPLALRRARPGRRRPAPPGRRRARPRRGPAAARRPRRGPPVAPLPPPPGPVPRRLLRRALLLARVRGGRLVGGARPAMWAGRAKVRSVDGEKNRAASPPFHCPPHNPPCSSALACAVADLRDYADATNDALLLASRALAGVAAAAGFGASAPPSPGALAAAWRPWAVSEKALWWHVPAWPPAGGAEEAGGEAAFRASLRSLAAGAADRLRAVLALTAPEAAPLADERLIGALMGAFELNNLGGSRERGARPGRRGARAPTDTPAPPSPPSPEIELPSLFDSLDPDAPADPAFDALLAAAGGRAAARAASVRGSAFYPLQSTANHSCAPTARAVPGAGTRGLLGAAADAAADAAGCPRPPPGATPAHAVLVAAVDLAPGDEVTLCYVDENADVSARAAALRDYGIAECDCARCAADRATGSPGPVRPAPPSRPRKRARRGGSGASPWLGAWRADEGG